MLMAVAMAAPGGAGEASAAAVAEPDYRVKLLLKGDAVDAEGQPSQALTSRFELGEFEGTERSVYVDTPDRFYGSRGWSIRLRHKEGRGLLRRHLQAPRRTYRQLGVEGFGGSRPGRSS